LTPDQAGFMGAWASLPSPEFERAFAEYHRGLRRTWSPSGWSLALGVYPSGEAAPAGGVDLTAIDFARTGVVSTAWWLLPEWRGRGLAREAVEALLHLAFDGLRALRSRAVVHPQNAASLAVGRAVGYVADGRERAAWGVEAVRLVLERRDWLPARREDIFVAGLSECVGLFGRPAAR
jgi:RimJ/RimL family protein N-acetyltransferase